MKNPPPRGYRAKEILTLLKDHGPLTAKNISLMVEPPMRNKKIYEALLRLKNRGLVNVRSERIIARGCSIYQLQQDLRARENTSKIIGVHPESLQQPYFRYREILHNDNCAVVAHNLKKQYPDAVLVRDFEFERSDIAKKIMLSEENDRDVKPDILLIFYNSNKKNITSIAFEIEKSRKDNRRLNAKLKKYASQSRVDGVVYICDENRIKEALLDSFINKVSPRAVRVKHYINYFLMFAENKNIQISPNDNLYDLNRKTVSLEKWISFLQNMKTSA